MKFVAVEIAKPRTNSIYWKRQLNINSYDLTLEDFEISSEDILDGKYKLISITVQPI
jgi:hypothetical protein